MSDFSDNQDKKLIRLVKASLSSKKRTDWKEVTRKMRIKGMLVSKVANRYKTLQRTYGKDLSVLASRLCHKKKKRLLRK
jgi:hypothetical protein